VEAALRRNAVAALSTAVKRLEFLQEDQKNTSSRDVLGVRAAADETCVMFFGFALWHHLEMRRQRRYVLAPHKA
jgi:hypothetical protein